MTAFKFRLGDREPFFSSDGHVGHDRIRELERRPFASLGEQDEALVTRWNEVVGNDDLAFYLGDFAIAPVEYQMRMLARMNGRKILIRGNHDGTMSRCRRVGWTEIYDELDIEAGGITIRLQHKPPDPVLRPARFGARAFFSGHVHGCYRVADYKGRPIVNCSVECWDYRPVPLSELLKVIVEFENRKEVQATESHVTGSA